MIQKSRKWLSPERVALYLIVVGFPAALILDGFNQIKPTLVDGVYVSSCCEPLIFKNGQILQHGKAISFELKNMKFGLTAYLSYPIEVAPGMKLGIRIAGHSEKPDEPPVLSFDNSDRPTRFTTLDEDGREVVFRRK